MVGRDNASGAFRSAGRSAEESESKISKFGAAILKTGAVLTGAAAVIGIESVKMATNFQASMEKIHTQAGGTQKDVQSLTSAVLNMKNVQQGPQELADSLFHLKSVGLDNVAAMKALRAASDLAATGGANLEETTNAIAGAWRSGIKGAQSFAQAGATVNAIIGAGNMRMSDFIDAIGTGILPSARTFGVSLKSVGAALALMTDEGIPANSAATRLRMSLSLLGAPSATAAKQLDTIGLTGLQLANAMRSPGGLVSAIALLKQHLDASGLSASNQAILLSRAFGGGRSSSAILTMVNNLAVLERKQQQINDTTGRYGGDVAAQRKTAQAQFAILRSSIDTIGIRIGMALLPPVTKFTAFLASTVVPGAVKAAGTISKTFNQIIPVKKIEQDWNSVLVYFGLRKVPKPKPVTLKPSDLYNVSPGSMVSSFAGWKPPSVKALTRTLGLPAITSTARVIMPVAPVYKQALGPGPAPFASMLPRALPKPAQMTSAFSGVNWGKVIGDAITSATTGAQQIGAGVITLLGKIDWLGLGKKLAFVLVPLAVGITNNLISALISEAVHHPLDMLMFLATVVPVGKAAGLVIDLFDKVPLLGPLTKWLLGPIEKAGSLVEGAFGKVLGKAFAPVKSLFVRAGNDVGAGMLVGISERWPKVADFLISMKGKILKPFAIAVTWLVKKGIDIIAGLWRGLEDRFPAVTGWLEKLPGRLVSPFKSAGGWLLSKGKDVISGLWDGVTGRWPAVSSWLGRAGSRVTAPFARAGRWLLDAGLNVIRGLGSGITGRWPAVSSWLGGVGGKVVSIFSRAGRWLLSAGSSIISGMLNGIRDEMSGIASWAKKWVVDPVINAIKHFFGIRSPSTVMHGIGGNLIAGLVRGIVTANPVGAIKKVFGSMPAALGHLVSKGLVSISALPAKALKALGGLGGDILNLLGIGGDSGARSHSAAVAQAYARSILGMYGWGADQMSSLIPLWNQESGWNAYAVNPSSGAYGIPQSLGHGHPYNLGDYVNQVIWGLDYIRGRYGSPAGAWAHERAFNWYEKGTAGAKRGWAWVGERGRELVKFRGGEEVLSHGDSMRAVAGKLPGYVSGTSPGEVKVLRADIKAELLRIHANQEKLKKAKTAVERAALRADILTEEHALANYRKRLKAAKGPGSQSALITYGRDLMRHHHKGVLDKQIASAHTRREQDVLLSKAAGLSAAEHARYARLARAAEPRLKHLKHERAGVRAYRTWLNAQDATLTRTIRAAKAHHLAGETARLIKTRAAHEKMVGDINLWTDGRRSFAPKPAPATTATAATVADPSLGDIAALVAALGTGWYGHGGTFAAGQLIGVGDRGPELVSFDRPGRVHSPEQSAAMTSGGEFTGNLYLDSGQLLGVVRGEIRRSNSRIVRAAAAGAGSGRG